MAYQENISNDKLDKNDLGLNRMIVIAIIILKVVTEAGRDGRGGNAEKYR